MLNFRPEAENVQVDLSGVDLDTMTDLDKVPVSTGSRRGTFRCPRIGYRFSS